LAPWPRRLPHTLTLSETSLWFNLTVSARRCPHKAAYRFLGQGLSVAELQRQAEALAGRLAGCRRMA
jgi:fatty-acyl-CoA synthase